MDIGVLLPAVKLVGDNVFAVPIGIEVYGASWDDAHKRWAQTFEQGPG